MTREEAIKMIEDDKRKNHDYLSSEYRKALNMAIEALKQPQQQWIPCSERLPEEGEKVLASTKNTVFTQVFKGIQGTNDSWWWNNNTIKTICAWMPIPAEPYKEK